MSARKKILVICPHPEDMVPGQRLKYEQYFESWRANGYDVDVSPFFSKRMQDILYKKGRIPEKIYWVARGYLKRISELKKVKQYDLLYIFLWVTPFGPPLFEKMFVKRNPHVVYDIDDAIFIKSHSLVNKWVDMIRGRKKPFFLMKKAKHVITCTPYLTEVALEYNDKVTDISSTINTDTYIPVNNFANDHTLVLGWSGSLSTIRFFNILKPTLLALQEKKPFKLVVMGDPDYRIEGLDMEAVEWTIEKEIPTLQRFDIGLYPLPLDDEWVLGKSGLKALQYMAVGVPVVATALGANYRIMKDGETGFLVKTAEEWMQRLEQLMDDPALRKRIGDAARKNVEDHYSIKANTPVYLSIINSAVKQ